MQPLLRRPALLAVAVAVCALAGSLAGCGGGSTPAPAPAASDQAVSSASGSAADAALAAGAALRASGGWEGLVEGTYSCRTTGSSAVLTMTAGATSMVVRSEKGVVVEGAYLAVGKDFGGPIPAGQGGTLTVKDGSATLQGASIPARAGGAPLVLDGTVTCR